jgi:hypothetical protein
MSFADSIHRMLIRRTRLKYYTIFITPSYELRAEFAFIIISSHCYYFIRCFSFYYIDNFYESREYFVRSFSF